MRHVVLPILALIALAACMGVPPHLVVSNAPTSPPLQVLEQEQSATVAMPELAGLVERSSALVLRASEIGAATGTPIHEPAPYRDTWWHRDGVDSVTLQALMGARGFRASHTFRAFVIEITLDEEHQRIVGERAFDWSGRSEQNYGWLVGSSVKFLAAAAALVRTRERGFTPAAMASFKRGHSTREASIEVLVNAALIESENIAYNRLVQLAGCDWLNQRFLTPEHGFAETAISEAYDQRKWRKLRMRSDLRFAPLIVLNEDEQVTELAPTRGQGRPACGGAACTNLRDIAEGMRRVALQEWLAPEERLDLHPDDLALMRAALATPRERGENVVEGLREIFGDTPLTIYHKPGYSDRWYSDVLFVRPQGSDHAWIIGLTARRGRRGLDRAARVLGRVLQSGELASASHHSEPPDDVELAQE